MGADAELDTFAASLEGLYNDDGSINTAPAPAKKAEAKAEPKAEQKPEPKAQAKPETELPAEGEESETAEDDTDDDNDDNDENDESEAEASSETEGARKPSSLEDLAEALQTTPAELLSLKVKTKVDGVEGEATLGELIKNYQLEGHVNRKSMALAEERKAFEQQAAQARQAVQSQVQQLAQSEELLKAMLWGEYGNVDWNRLVEDDPDEYQRKYLGYQQRYGQLKLVQETLAQHTQAAQQAARQQYEAYLNEQRRELANRMPAWNESKTSQAAMTELDEYLSGEYGLEQGTIHKLDHWSGPVIAWKALQYDKLQKETAAVKSKVREAPRFAKPGTGGGKTAADTAKSNLKLKQKLRSPHGSTDALAKWLLDTNQV